MMQDESTRWARLEAEGKGAEVCPAGWEPGQPVLKVGPDLVGKVWTVWKPNE